MAEHLPSTAGLDNAAVRAQRVFDLETALAAAHWDNVKTRDSVATYNPMSWAEVKELVAKGARSAIELEATVGSDVDQHVADLDIWLTALEAPAGALDTVVVREPSFLEGLGALLTQEHLEAWRDWLSWNIIHSAAPFLPAAFVSENFDFYGRTLTGTPEQRERWKRGVSLVEGSMGEAVGRVYVERHFPERAKAEMDVLVSNLIEAYRESINNLEWMTHDTK